MLQKLITLLTAMALASLSLQTLAARAGEKGPSDRAYEQAGDNASFKRDRHPDNDRNKDGKKHKKKDRHDDDDDRHHDKDRKKDEKKDKKKDRHDDDDDRDRDSKSGKGKSR